MASLRSLLLGLVRSRWFLAYYAVNLIGRAAHEGSFAGMPRDHRSSLSAAVLLGSMALFYLLLAEARVWRLGAPAIPAWRLLLFRWLARLRLGLLLVPVAIVMFATRQDELIKSRIKAYESSSGLPEANADGLVGLLSAAWPWLAVFLVFYLIDTCSGAVVVAQGDSKRALRNGGRLLLRAPGLALGLFLADLATNTLIYAGGSTLVAVVTGSTQAAVAVSALTVPVSLFLRAGGALLLGERFLGTQGTRTGSPETPQ